MAADAHYADADAKGSRYYRESAAEVRRVLEKDEKVLAVLQAHNHAGHDSRIEGIHYYTLKAMVEGSGADNSAYAVVDVNADRSITVTGYRKAVSRGLAREKSSGAEA